MLHCIFPAFNNQQSHLKSEKSTKPVKESLIYASFYNLICASRRLECKEWREAIIDPAGKEHVVNRPGP